MKKEERPYIEVGVIIQNNNGEVLLGNRMGSHGQGSWSIPGGHVEFGETLAEAAKKEVLEETGLSVAGLSIVSVSDDFMKSEGKHYVSIGFLAKGFEGVLEIREPEKCAEWRWFTMDALPENMFGPSENTLQNFKRGGIYYKN